ncbi:MAG: hypothetical protein HIU83_13775 [Proteobacteria bacterium]|nr:hypothetical protein [Pseudomonadota bacterium]
MRSISEADWKVYRQLHPILLNRYCQQVLKEIGNIGSENEKSEHERYLAIYQAIQRHDREIELLFNNPRRSSALMQIMTINNRGLFTKEELILFSADIHALFSRF